MRTPIETKMLMDKIALDKENHIYRVDGRIIPGVNEILQAGGFIDFSKVNSDIMIAAQKFGKAVHLATAFWDEKRLNTDILSEPLVPYLEAWKNFKRDYKIKIDLEGIEKSLYSRIWKFCGTPDRFPVVIKNKLTLIDIKSSNVMLPATALQLAGYQILLAENLKVKIKQRWSVQLKNNGDYKIHPYTELTDKSTFVGAVQGYNFKKKHNLLEAK